MNDLDPPAWIVLAPVALYALVPGLSLVLSRRISRVAQFLPSLVLMLGAGAGVLVALLELLGTGSTAFTGWAVTPQLDLSLRLDPLAAFFLLVISVPAAAAACYGIGYLNASHGTSQPAPRAAADALLGAFLASMTLVVLADSVIGFLIAWELMSLVSFFLVVGDGRRAEARRSGYVYVVMTHIGTGFLLLAFLILARHSGSFDFSAFRATAGSIPAWEQWVILLLALLGFGAKMGLIPLHVWLPRAHPAAPSHISALMSGVMVKIAVYGLIRICWEFTPRPPLWWGVLLVGLGLTSAVLGILYALMERDLKRVLAYSTVEHLGIITVGLGVAALASNRGHATVAALALLATLVHLLNHSVFKGLLFLGAGAVQTGAGTRDLERLGGLIRRMPWTTGSFLIGSMAIAALPPLNGFAGEWLIFQSLLSLGTTVGTPMLAVVVALAAGGLALTAALSLACFVRAFGVGFLAQPRSEATHNAHEVGYSMRAGMALLAAVALALGLFPLAVLRLLQPVTLALVGTTVRPSFGGGAVLDAAQRDGSYAPLLVVIGLAAIGVIPWLAARILNGRGHERVVPTWVCGGLLEPRMQYSATAFAQPIRLIFRQLIRPHRSVAIERPVSTLLVPVVHFEEGVHPIYERYLYQRAVTVITSVSHRIRILQSGSIRAYLAYIFVTLLIILVITR